MTKDSLMYNNLFTSRTFVVGLFSFFRFNDIRMLFFLALYVSFFFSFVIHHLFGTENDE